MKLKNLTIGILSMIAALTLAACNGGGDEEAPADQPTDPATEEQAPAEEPAEDPAEEPADPAGPEDPTGPAPEEETP